MMRQIYITANGAVDATGWRGRPRRADSACRGSDSQTYLVRTSLRGRGGFLADVELRTIKEVDLKGGTVVAAFPSVGLVSTITATYLITGLKVDQVVALESPDFPRLGSGMAAGVPGVLLTGGRWRDADVIAPLGEARLSVPDATAAVSLVRVLDTLLPEISIDLEPLQHQAKLLEEHLTKLKQQAPSVVPPEPIPSEMYR